MQYFGFQHPDLELDTYIYTTVFRPTAAPPAPDILDSLFIYLLPRHLPVCLPTEVTVLNIGTVPGGTLLM